MILDIYIMLNVLAFVFLGIGLFVGLMRSYLLGGKGVAIISFFISILMFIMLAFSSLDIELTMCGTDCELVPVSYDYMSYLYYFFTLLNLIMMIVYTFLSFGDLLKGGTYGPEMPN